MLWKPPKSCKTHVFRKPCKRCCLGNSCGWLWLSKWLPCHMWPCGHPGCLWLPVFWAVLWVCAFPGLGLLQSVQQPTGLPYSLLSRLKVYNICQSHLFCSCGGHKTIFFLANAWFFCSEKMCAKFGPYKFGGSLNIFGNSRPKNSRFCFIFMTDGLYQFLVEILHCLLQGVPQDGFDLFLAQFWRPDPCSLGQLYPGAVLCYWPVFPLAANGWLGMWLAGMWLWLVWLLPASWRCASMAVLRLARFAAWWLWLDFAQTTWLLYCWLACCCGFYVSVAGFQ